MPEDILQSLSGSKDQLAQASEIAKGVASGALPTAEAFKIPDQVAAAQQALEGLPPGPNFDAAKDAMGNATKAADALKDELAQKLPEPVSQGKDALTGLGQEVKASGGGITAVSGMLPEVKLPISDASKSLGDLKSKVPSAESLQSKIPDVQAKLAPLQEKIPDLASKLDPPKDVINGLVGKMGDVIGGVKPLLDKPPLSMALDKAGTADLVKQHLAMAEEKLPQVPPLLDQAKAKLMEAIAPLTDAGAKLAEMQAGILAAVPPPPNIGLDALQEQISGANAVIANAAGQVDTAVTNLPAAQQNVDQAQQLIATASDQMKPEELKKAMDQIGQLVGDAQKAVAAPAGAMPDVAQAVAGLPNQVASIQQAATGVLPGAAASVPDEQKAKAAELLGLVQDSLNQAPDKINEGAPAVQQLADQLPKVDSPLSQAVQTMHDALTPPQQDLAELEKQLKLAEGQITEVTTETETAKQNMDASQKKVEGAIAIQDPAEMNKTLDEIIAGLATLDDKTIADLEKKLPDLEALVERIEKAGGAA